MVVVLHFGRIRQLALSEGGSKHQKVSGNVTENKKEYGFGYVIAAFAMLIVGLWKLLSFTQHLDYHAFCQ